MTIAAFAGGGAADQTDAATAPPRRPRRRRGRDGLQVWIANGCGGCHTFEPAGTNAPIGPDLGQSLKGKTATT